MIEAGRLLLGNAEAPGEDGKFRATMNLLEGLCDSHPEVLRSVVAPAIRALKLARQRGDEATAPRLERFLLRLAGAAPEVIVSGVVVVGNPRFRGASKKRGRTGKRRNKPHMVRAIRGAAQNLRDAFVVPASQRLIREGYKPLADRLALIIKALDSVVSVASAPAPPLG